MSGIKTERGFVLTASVIIIVIVSLVAGYVLTTAYNHKRLLDQVSGKRTKAWYRAQAGIVDAHWRIRVNFPGDLRDEAGGSRDFTRPAYNPRPYFLDLNPPESVAPEISLTDVNFNWDVKVDIGPVQTSGTNKGFRPIQSTGRD